MSQWTHVDGHVNGVNEDLSDEKTPEGSEGGESLNQYMPHNWMWYADLRDRGEEEVPMTRDWFESLCKRTQPSDAKLRVDVESGGRYDFEWNGKNLALHIPPLFRDELESEWTEREANV